ncbi:MAG TPA: RidA family protein [Rhodanobacteraceae bacterium]|nr:RidA family protein [Rhodanobacteraceae bacterium]
MAIKRFGSSKGQGTGGQPLPFSQAVQAGGWLYVSGQAPMRDGEVVEGSITEQARLALHNCLRIMEDAGYRVEDVVHVTAILSDARYFAPFNKVFREFFADHAPARICSVQDLVVDCKVELDVTCYRDG